MAFVVSFWLIALITLSVLFFEEEEVKRVVNYDHFCLFKGLLQSLHAYTFRVINFKIACLNVAYDLSLTTRGLYSAETI